MLADHLEQINASASGIGDLECAHNIQLARPFTNALLHNQEITALIRDTEPHEQGLFSVVPTLSSSDSRPLATASALGADATTARRKTTTHAQSHPPSQSSTIARVLGSDLLHKIRASSRDSSHGRRVDVEVLLQGAEKLCAVYALPGSLDRIATLRSRHDQISSSIKVHEERLSSQQLSMSRFEPSSHQVDYNHDDPEVDQTWDVTDQDIKNEEEAIKELEAKKRTLETRLAVIERDLGGLLK